MFDYNNDPFAEGARKYQQELIEKALQKYLAKCIQNNYHCAHCYRNHNGICAFAKECFENDQKFYQDEEDEELE